MSRSILRSPRIIAAILTLPVVWAACGPRPAGETKPEQGPNPAYRSNPPRIRQASLRLLERERPEGNMLIRATVDDARRVGTQFRVRLEQGIVLMRDDGAGGDERASDGVFSAIVRVDVGALRARSDRLRQLPDAQRTIPIFDEQRRLIERRPLRPFFPEALQPLDTLPFFPFGIPTAVDPARSLMVTTTLVVTDKTRTFNICTGVGNPTGKWTFGYAMTQLANTPLTGITPSAFARRWVGRWEFLQMINDWPVAARTAIQARIIAPWVAASGGSGTLDLTKAPFRLLAIVNRVDLRENLVYGSGSAGEARLVFGAVDVTNNCAPLPFAVIFEYGIRKNGCVDLRTWARQWNDLGTLALGSPAYNDALEAITEQFVPAGSDPSKPNGSALNQLRTNEIALAGPWELREFRLFGEDSDAGHLREVTVKQTPDASLNGTKVLADFVNSGATDVPLEFPTGAHFLGGSAPVPPMFWDGPPVPPGPDIVPADLRHGFSLRTCSGCHAAETSTPFVHIDPMTTPAALSGFLTGITVNDPADGAPARTFNDLDRRRADLDALVNSVCIFDVFFRPLRFVH
jgi:hypothetical protein